MTPVTVVTGFLGAGKSTLLEAWLRDQDRDRVAVIVNERGEVGVDGALLASRVARLREITAGCVCCETQAELAAALDELSGAGLARVFVETSGAASPAGVIRPVTRIDGLRLDGVITVLDASRLERALGFDLAIEQLGFADVVVLSHADREDEDALARAEEAAARHAPAAVIARSGRGDAPALGTLLDRRDDALRVFPEARGHHPIEAVSVVAPGELDEDRFADWVEAALGAVEARILRIKGILAMHGVDARVIVQGVGEAVEVSLGAPWGDAPRDCRLVVLGLGLDAAAIEAGFRRCLKRQ